METKEIIKNSLNSPKNNSLRHICKELGEEKEQVILDIMQYMETRIKEVTTNQRKNHNDIIRGLELLENVSWGKIEGSLNPYQKKIRTMLYQVRHLIDNSTNKKNKTYYFLSDLQFSLEGIEQKIHSFQTSEELHAEYQYLYFLIFELRNLTYIQITIAAYPDLLRTEGPEGTIVDTILDRYLKAVVEENMEDYIYFEHVLEQCYRRLSSTEKAIFKKMLVKSYHKHKKKNDLERTNPLLQDLENKMFPKKRNNFQNQLQYLNNLYGFSKNFSASADAKINENWKAQDRSFIDCTNKYIVSIDTQQASLYEDAISLERLDNGNYLLGIYISDVASYIGINSELGKEMLQRSKDLYLPDQVYKLVPETYLNKLSLEEGKNKIALGNFFEFSPSFQLIHFDVKNTIVRIKRHLSFEQFENIDKQIHLSIEELENLKQLIIFGNQLNLDFIKMEQYHDMKEWMKEVQGLPNSYQKSNSSVFISKLMILTNYLTASFFYEFDLPFVYRINQLNSKTGSLQKVEERYFENPNIRSYLKLLNKIYEPSKYSEINYGHAGLGLDAYGHTTCPARNYASFFNQHLIQMFLINELQKEKTMIREYAGKVQNIAQFLNDRNELMNQYQKEYCNCYYNSRHK